MGDLGPQRCSHQIQFGSHMVGERKIGGAVSTAFKKTGLGCQMKETGNMIRRSCVPFFQGLQGLKRDMQKQMYGANSKDMCVCVCVRRSTYLDTGAVCSHVMIEGVCVLVCVSVCTCGHLCAILARTDRYLPKHSPEYMNLLTYARADTHVCIHIQSKRYTGIGLFIHALRKAKVEVYFTDGSWVSAIVQHARGMHARSLLAAVLEFRGLGFTVLPPAS